MSKLQNLNIISEIKNIITVAREKVTKQVNNELLLAYWQIGKIIVEYEKNNENVNAKTMLEISKVLTKELGGGFSRSNLFNMKKFYQTYQTVQTLSDRFGLIIANF